MSASTDSQTDPATLRSEGPDFLCIGQQKAGTKWLYDVLQFQAGFWMPPVKELHFFDRAFPLAKMNRFGRNMAGNLDDFSRRKQQQQHRALDQRDLEFVAHAVTYDQNHLSIDWYKSLFVPKGNLVSGDITPAYSALDDGVIAEIAQTFPDLRIILLVRDPVSRAWSAYNMNRRREIIGRRVKDPSVESLSAFHRPEHAEKVAAYLEQPGVRKKSFGSVIYRTWCRHFDAAHVELVFFDDIVDSPARVIRRLRGLFGLEDMPPSAQGATPDFNRKAGKAKREMNDEIRALLVERFHDELLRCAEMFGGPAEGWARRYGLG